MSGKKRRPLSRRATEKEARAIAAESAAMAVDAGAAASLSSCTVPEGDLYASLPDEERDLLRKVDFSVLQRELMEVSILDDASLRQLGKEALIGYASGISSVLRFYVKQYEDAARELGNAMELIMNQRTVLFGRSSQRTAAILGDGGKAPAGKAGGQEGDPAGGTDGMHSPGGISPAQETAPETRSGETGTADVPDTGESAAAGGTDTLGKEEDGEGGRDGKKSRQPRRTPGCAGKVYENAKTVLIDCEIPKEKLDALYGEGGWKEMPSADRKVTEYTVIPATIVVKIYHLHAYSASDCTDPDVRGVIRAENPLSGKRARAKSPISGGMMADILHTRGSMRVPVCRICDNYRSGGLSLTPQRVYENIAHYSGLFRHLLDRMWAELLRCHCIQVDETPVRYFDRKAGKVRRGYLWVFTTGEMLDSGRPVTLFHYAEGRDAEVLRRCLGDKGFEGVVGSDGLSSYHVFARESGGKVTNAGCLDHFRKRLVMALRAVPGLDKMTEGERERIPSYVIWKRLNAVFMLDRKTKEFGTKEERDAYRDGTVREAFDGLAASVREAGAAGSPKGSYLSGAVTYFTNQEVYLREFLDDSNIASNNSKAERKFAFFAVLRNQIKMFGSVRGAEDAACLESLEQTAREYVGNTRIYYQYLIDKYCPFVRAQEDGASISILEEIDDYLPWSEEWKLYESSIIEKEKILTSVAVNF